jgi:hypothetical protein
MVYIYNIALRMHAYMHIIIYMIVTQKFPFSKILEVVSRPEFAQDHESGLRSDRGPVLLCDFSKLRFWKSPYDF